MTIGERIKKLRTEQGMSQDELASKVGYKTRSAVNKIELGERDVKHSQVIEFANALNTSPNYLMGWEDNPMKEEPNANMILPPKFYNIPLYESVSAGFGHYADSQILEYIQLYIDSSSVARDTLAIKVKGDSMYPKIEDGDIILVQITGTIESGRIGVVMIGEDAFVKRIEYDRKSLRLISINPEYSPKIFTGKEAESVQIVGRVYRIIKEV